MAKQRTPSPSRTMKRVFLVFCEGETEETYLDYLKQTYRSPMRIVPKAEGGSIFFDINLSLKNLFLFPHIKISCLTKAYLCNLITPDKW